MPQEVSTIYSLGKVLGRGQFGTTRLAVEKATGKEFACKSISKRKLTCAAHCSTAEPPCSADRQMLGRLSDGRLVDFICNKPTD